MAECTDTLQCDNNSRERASGQPSLKEKYVTGRIL